MCFGDHQFSLTVATVFGIIALGFVFYYRKKLMDGGADKETVAMQIKKLLQFSNITNPLTPLPYYVISFGFFAHALYTQVMCQ